MTDRHPEILNREDSVLVVVDVQERLLPAMIDGEHLVRATRRAVRGAVLLGIPVLFSEQYPRGLGSTVAELVTAAPLAPRVAKTTFSACGEESFLTALRALDRGTVVVAGIEAHICVAQTALDLRARGYRTGVLTDAVATRISGNLALGLDRMARAGVVPASVESALFDWLVSSAAPEFKAVQALLMDSAS